MQEAGRIGHNATMLIHPQFDPIALQVGPLAIHWYGPVSYTHLTLPTTPYV